MISKGSSICAPLWAEDFHKASLHHQLTKRKRCASKAFGSHTPREAVNPCVEPTVRSAPGWSLGPLWDVQVSGTLGKGLFLPRLLCPLLPTPCLPLAPGKVFCVPETEEFASRSPGYRRLRMCMQGTWWLLKMQKEIYVFRSDMQKLGMLQL